MRLDTLVHRIIHRNCGYCPKSQYQRGLPQYGHKTDPQKTKPEGTGWCRTRFRIRVRNIAEHRS